MNNEVSISLAFLAGLFSFFSPCVLPLIPSYLCLLGGFTPEQLKQGAPEHKWYFLARTVGFVGGFSLVFIILSLLFAAGLHLLGAAAQYIHLAAGLIIILLGLNILFDFLACLNYEKRFYFKRWPPGVGGAVLAGSAFGAGWTPCAGPILGSILLLAGQSGRSGTAALYLTAYSTGLGLPFLLAAFFLERFSRSAAALRVSLPLIRRLSGVLLLVIGGWQLLAVWPGLINFRGGNL